ncbi:MAG: hypothetical protein E7062_04320 [Spirochaetaceae bacterium]|nr:hypothetical protein [Spirochaetaceae bacterium]
MNQTQKQFILKISISIVVVLILTTLLAFLSILLKNYSNNKIEKEVFALLSATYGESLILKENVNYKNTTTFTVISFLYDYSEKKQDTQELRAFCFSLTGLSGPVPVLYTVKGKNEPEFIGILDTSLKDRQPLLYGLTPFVIEKGKEMLQTFLKGQDSEVNL